MGFIPKHGGYKNLLSYQKAVVIYDATIYFCERYIGTKSRTYDQMVQAARSGKQNIIEGSRASATSKETEIKLTNVARASLEELLEDYLDYLRSHKMIVWDKNYWKALKIRQVGLASEATYCNYSKYIERGSPEDAANTVICIIHQANYLLNRQISSLEKSFMQNGGIREHMTKARIRERRG